MKTALSVNVNKVALLRNSRANGLPSVLHACTIALQAGAQGITIHPRPDERHIRRSDVPDGVAATVHFSGTAVEQISETYGDVHAGSACALFGSSDYLEIAVHRGNASEQFDLRRGNRVEVRF